MVNYDYKVREEVENMEDAYNHDAKVSLQWPFGYGLSAPNMNTIIWA